MDQIEGKGNELLPWEGHRLTPATRQQLGIFKDTLLNLLHRDPARRPSMKEFCRSCNRVLSGSTSVQV
jgi:hypothetical protein